MFLVGCKSDPPVAEDKPFFDSLAQAAAKNKANPESKGGMKKFNPSVALPTHSAPTKAMEAP